LTAQQLKEALEGDKRLTKDRPEIWVTIKEVVMKDDQMKINLAKFSLQGVKVNVEVKIMGTDSQIVHEIGSEAALKLMDRVGVSANLKRPSEYNGKAPSALSPNKEKIERSLLPIKERSVVPDSQDKVASGSGSWDEPDAKSFHLSTYANLIKEADEDQVVAEVKTLEALVRGRYSSVASDALEKQLAKALGERTTEFVKQARGRR